MELALTSGQMEENMKASIRQIKSMDMGYLNGIVVRNMKEDGIMGSNMG